MSDLSEKVRVNLTELPVGKPGFVVDMYFGRNFESRLNSLGVRLNSGIERLTGPYLPRGPIRVKIDQTEIIIGYGEARKIIVEYEI